MVDTIKLFLHQGGFAAWLIALAGLILLVVGIERLLYLYFGISSKTGASYAQLQETILARKYTEAIQICSRSERSPELKMIKSGLLALDNGREAIRNSLGSMLTEISRGLENRVPIIALVASSATLLGLLGTITGLIKTFSAMASADPSMKAKLLGEGISEAMYATAVGLGVGITALVVHTLCTSKIDQIYGKCQDAGFKLVTWIEQSERSGGGGR